MRGVAGGSLFVACIGVINLASVIGIPVRGDVVTDWNNAALDVIRADRTAPPIASRSLAIGSRRDLSRGERHRAHPRTLSGAKRCVVQRLSRSHCQRRSAPDACQPVSKPHIYL